MAELDRVRSEIEAVDAEMAKLFQRRMEAAARVAEYKREHNLPVLDKSRERALIEKNAAHIENPAHAPYYKDFLRHLISLSRQYQTEILGRGTVAYQGVQGGFGHHVATTLHPHATLLAQPTFEAVFKAVEGGTAAFGIVPFENSTTGDVSGVLDLCYNHSCYISSMFDLPVQQNLLGLPGAKLCNITEIYSHVQGLEQSSRFLRSLGAKLVPYANTAAAAKYVAECGDATKAAIASLESAEVYGLVPLAKDIATEANNTTRFIVISREKPAEGGRFALLVTVENTVGQLNRVIQTISEKGFNMENIKSRPMPKRPWEYYFYIELVGKRGAAGTTILVEAIAKVCLSVRMLGVFNRKQAGEAP